MSTAWTIPLHEAGHVLVSAPLALVQSSAPQWNHASLLSMQTAASERRDAIMQARKHRAQKAVEHAKRVAKQTAQRLDERAALLQRALAHKQATAAQRRVALHQRNAKVSPPNPSTGLITATDFAKKQEAQEVKSWRAHFKLCQRLACVVAKRRLHNAHALECCKRVKSARVIQLAFRQCWRRANRADCARILLANQPAIMTSFDCMLAHCTRADVMQAATRVCNDNAALGKTLLAAQMLVNHCNEVLSLPRRECDIARFAARRLLVLCAKQFDSRAAFNQFRAALPAFASLLAWIKEKDRVLLCHQVLEAMINVRIEYESCEDATVEIKRGHYDQFLTLQAKLKRLCGTGGEGEYKQYLSLCAHQVKRKLQSQDLVRKLVMDPNFQLQSFADPVAPPPPPPAGCKDLDSKQILAVLDELKRRINALTPNRLDLHQELDEGVDLDLIGIELKHGMRAWIEPVMALLLGRLEQLRAPNHRPARSFHRSNQTSALQVLDHLLRDLAQIELDLANVQLGVLSQHLRPGSATASLHVRGRNFGKPSMDVERLARLCLGATRIASEKDMDPFEWKQVGELQLASKQLLLQARNQILLKQVAVAHLPPALIPVVERTKIGPDALFALRQLAPEASLAAAQDMLHNLLRQGDALPLCRLLERRLLAALLLPRLPPPAQEKYLLAMGMQHLKSELENLFSRFHALFWLVRESRRRQ